jgi:hypothetical protein
MRGPNLHRHRFRQGRSGPAVVVPCTGNRRFPCQETSTGSFRARKIEDLPDRHNPEGCAVSSPASRPGTPRSAPRDKRETPPVLPFPAAKLEMVSVTSPKSSRRDAIFCGICRIHEEFRTYVPILAESSAHKWFFRPMTTGDPVGKAKYPAIHGKRGHRGILNVGFPAGDADRLRSKKRFHTPSPRRCTHLQHHCKLDEPFPTNRVSSCRSRTAERERTGILNFSRGTPWQQ